MGVTLRLDVGARGAVKLQGLEELMRDATLEELNSSADQIKQLAKQLVRVDTGSLQRSIRKERGGVGARWAKVRVRAGGYVTNPKTGLLVNYASIIESKYPFMMPAWLIVREGMVERIEQRIEAKWNE